MFFYRIHIQGWLDQEWNEWFTPLVLCHLDHGTSELSGFLPDQAALYGILNKLHHLGLTLLLVRLERP